jgi:hypothetical protein
MFALFKIFVLLEQAARMLAQYVHVHFEHREAL